MSLGSNQAAVAMPFGLPEQISQTPLKPVMDAFGIKLVSYGHVLSGVLWFQFV